MSHPIEMEEYTDESLSDVDEMIVKEDRRQHHCTRIHILAADGNVDKYLKRIHLMYSIHV